MATKKAAKKSAKARAVYRRWHVDSTPNALEEAARKAAEHPELTHHGLTQGADDAVKATNEARRPLGATNTRIPDPGGNPALYVSADDVAVRVGGYPIRNPTAVSGLAIAPGAAGVVADTGPLAAGTYLLELNLAASALAAAGKHIQVEHRNAANAATINTLAGCAGGQMFSSIVGRIVIAANERIRAVIGAVAFAASEGAIASIRAYRLDV